MIDAPVLTFDAPSKLGKVASVDTRPRTHRGGKRHTLAACCSRKPRCNSGDDRSGVPDRYDGACDTATPRADSAA